MTVQNLARGAREAARELALATRFEKDAALAAMADALDAAVADILAANKEDVDAAVADGTPAALIDRLRLDESRVAGMSHGLRHLIGLVDPVGEVVRGWQTGHGLKISQVRVPFGVIGIIYEARPNVTADAAGICLKAGNAALLRGSSSALNSNRAVVKALRAGLEEVGMNPDAVSLVEGGRETTTEMMQARGLIDVLIPRGGAGLINAVVKGSSIPVIETGTGNCHLYIDATADQGMALEILLNGKTQRPSVCNATETLLVHEDIAGEFLPQAIEALLAAGVTIHGDETVQAVAGKVAAEGADGANVVPATLEDYATEYLSLDIAVRVVPTIDEAISHVRKYTTGHSETIVTGTVAASNQFVNEVDAATVLVNASSRFVDGGEFGFGAEIGISTQKLHARGPMAVAEMTSTKFVVEGSGQTRG
ncbi:MAG: glutamate-5-semialdehyde dehydrogenase [Actinomycetaceae bacterium]|nr:glutamate-5-semialdehyde dehydrogenase [Actinomycetaceae bacterium]